MTFKYVPAKKELLIKIQALLLDRLGMSVSEIRDESKNLMRKTGQELVNILEELRQLPNPTRELEIP